MKRNRVKVSPLNLYIYVARLLRFLIGCPHIYRFYQNRLTSQVDTTLKEIK